MRQVFLRSDVLYPGFGCQQGVSLEDIGDLVQMILEIGVLGLRRIVDAIARIAERTDLFALWSSRGVGRPHLLHETGADIASAVGVPLGSEGWPHGFHSRTGASGRAAVEPLRGAALVEALEPAAQG